MPYVDDDEPPASGFHGARPGVSAADLAFDEPGVASYWGGTPHGAPAWGGDPVGGDPGLGADGGGGLADGPSADGWDEPPLWPVLGGGWFRLPRPVWGRWRGRPRLHRSLGGLLRRARQVGTLRHRGTGERFPVYRARMAKKSWRVVGRPRGRSGEMEIVALQPEREAFPVSASPFVRPSRHGGSPRYGGPRYGGGVHYGAPRYGGPARRGPRFGGGLCWGVPRSVARRWRLRLPHRGLHTVLSRLQPEQLRALAGGDLPPDPAPAVVRAVAALARRARPAGRLSGGFTVFATPGWRMLVRPLGELQGEIVALRPVEGEVYRPGDPKGKTSIGGKSTYVRGSQVSLEWSGPFMMTRPKGSIDTVLVDGTTKKAVSENRPGIYVATRGGKPVYVGQATQLAKRWAGRCRIFGELDLAVDLSDYRVWLGAITASNQPKKGPEGLGWLLNDLEHVVIRRMLRDGHALTNRTSFSPIVAAPQGIRIANNGKVPPFLGARIEITSQDQPYELQPLPA